MHTVVIPPNKHKDREQHAPALQRTAIITAQAMLLALHQHEQYEAAHAHKVTA